MSKRKPKIFLSYAHEDIGMAKRLYQDLKRYGLNIWFDDWSIRGGQIWEDEIRTAIRGSDCFIILSSSNSMIEESYVQIELKIAFEVYYENTEQNIDIIPVRLDDCPFLDKRLNKFQWINLFPKIEYQIGFKKILQVVSPRTFLLRSEPMELSEIDVNEMIRMHGFFDNNQNIGGKGFSHKYKLQEINGDKVVFDEISCLMWQQRGSSMQITFEAAKKYLDELNEKQFAGFNDWRLPTLEEAMSLMESEKKHDLNIDPIFDDKQWWIWTVDQAKEESWVLWAVNFSGGVCGYERLNGESSVRAVRSGQSSIE